MPSTARQRRSSVVASEVAPRARHQLALGRLQADHPMVMDLQTELQVELQVDLQVDMAVGDQAVALEGLEIFLREYFQFIFVILY